MIDNLIKGASGAAIQNMNLQVWCAATFLPRTLRSYTHLPFQMGLPQETGLDIFEPMYP